MFTRHAFVVLILVAGALFLWQIADVLLLAFTGVLLAVFFRGLASLISRYVPISVGWALPLVAIMLITIIVLFVLLAGPSINKQFSQLTETLPNSVDQVRQLLSQYSWAQYMYEQMTPKEWSASRSLNLFSRITGAASSAFTVITNIIIIVSTAIYFSINPDSYKHGIVLLAPRSKSARVAEALEMSAHVLRKWLIGKAVAMLFVGVATWFGLWLIDVPLAFLLGIVSGLLDFVPYLGPIAAAVPAVLIALTAGWTTASYAVLVFVIVQQLEANVITPIAQREAASLPPALVVLAVVAFGLVFGLLGILIATPLTVVALVFIRMLYVEDVLGKSTKRA